MIIKIFGGDGEGKSTIAKWLELELKKLHIKVENEDMDSTMDLDERLKILATAGDELEVTIKTIPYRAEKKPRYSFYKKT
jgi:thymidylate kinase